MDSFKLRVHTLAALLILLGFNGFEGRSGAENAEYPRPPFGVKEHRSLEYSAPPFGVQEHRPPEYSGPPVLYAEQRPDPPRPPFVYSYTTTEQPPSGHAPANATLDISESKYSTYSSSTKNYCDSRDPPGCLKRSLSFCVNDYDYPGQLVRRAIEKDDRVLKKISDVSGQSTRDLVDGLGYSSEEYFDYSTYTGRQFDKGNWFGSEGYVCPSTVLYAKPSRARNVQGDWRVIVQGADYYSQTERIETCTHRGKPCRFIPPCYKTRCIQKYSYRRLLAFDPCHQERGLFVDSFKLPSACSCSITFDYYY